MGGGKKRQPLSKAEKAQRKRAEERKKSGLMEKKVAGIIPPDFRDDKVAAELKKMRFLTPYIVASKYDLRLSVAKDFLEQLQRRGAVELVSKSRNLKIYKPTSIA